ncbi:MAG: 16S rRNA (cytosine(1402)-N(4))-methyltransferase RsmH [Candidatus Paceibacterota bacterium]
MIHIPVLQKEVLKYLEPKENENFIDCTLGAGGHAISILSKNKPKGKVLGIEADPFLSQRIKDPRLIVVNDSYINLQKIIKENGFEDFSGILFDLGMSSFHIDKSQRGFSFLKDEMLDMRYNFKSDKGITAEDIVNKYPKEEIELILKKYGEEEFAKKIAKEITEERRKNSIKSTFQLVEVIRKAVPRWYCKRRIHFATKTFQALRIAVNDELENVKKGLSLAIEILPSSRRIVVISFHSLEDRLVKNIFKESKNLKILTKKPVIPLDKEINENKRARSAKLRAAIKI